MSSSPSTPSGRSPKPLAISKYGRIAMTHWQQTDPARYRTIPESERKAFFSEPGERAESENQQLQDHLTGPDRPNESYFEKVGRLSMARLQAEQRVLRELILIAAPEASEDEEEELDGVVSQHMAFKQEIWTILHKEGQPET